MYQQNKKNGNLILMKNRRILTRTQQSKQKLKANLNNNNVVYKTHRQQQTKILRYQERKNFTQHKSKSNENLDHSIFWKAAKNKKIKADCYSLQKTQSFYENSSPRNYQKAEDRPKIYNKNNSRVYGILKKKIFSHKNLIQGSERIRSNTSESTLRINNDNITQNQIPSDNTQCQDSQRITQRTFYLKGIKNFTKRFKTENIQPEQNNVQKVLKSIYSSRRRKLRLNSNEFSVELRINGKKQIQEDQTQNNRQEDTLITTRTQNRKSLKLPKQLIKKIKQKGEKSQAISSPVNLSFSSDNDNLQRKNFNIQHKNDSNKNKIEMVDNRKKSKTLLSNELMYRIQEQNSLLQKGHNQIDQVTQKSSRDPRFVKKQTPHVVKNTKSKIFQSQTISIQDIEVVCLNQSQNVTKKNSLLENNQEIQNKTIEKNQSQNKSKNINQNKKLIPSNPIEKRIKKLRIKQESPIKNIAKQEIYKDTQQIGFMEQINLSNPQNNTSIQIIKDFPKNYDTSLQNPKILNTYTIESIEEQKTKRQKLQKQQDSFLQSENQTKFETIKLIKIEKQKEQFFILKSKIQELNCIGQVGGQCSRYFSKKNLTWMVPTLLFYVYCLHFRKKAKQIFIAALKSQFCLQSQYQDLVQQNQYLQVNISKIYQKSKKKNLIAEQIQNFIQTNFDLQNQKVKFLNTLFNQLVKFVDLLIKREAKQSTQKKKLYLCGIKMIMAFMVVLKTQKQQYSKSQRNTNISSNKEVFINMPQIEFSNLDIKKASICLEQSLKLLKQNFQNFLNFING